MILQGVGGGVASAALVNSGGAQIQSLHRGAQIITAGLIFQVITLFIFMVVGGDLALQISRCRRRLGDALALSQEPHLVRIRASWQFSGFLGAMIFATILIFWRSAYRVAELNKGWTGPLTFNQDLFVSFEGILMVLVVSALGIFHPALCMGAVMDKVKSDASTGGSGALGSETRLPSISRVGDGSENTAKTEEVVQFATI